MSWKRLQSSRSHSLCDMIFENRGQIEAIHFMLLRYCTCVPMSRFAASDQRALVAFITTFRSIEYLCLE